MLAMARELTPAQKKRYISIKYFGCTDSPKDDVNPYDSLQDFLDNEVGTLNWGTSPEVREHTKERAANTLSKMVTADKVILSPNMIFEIISKDDILNKTAVSRMIDKAIFPLIK
jgi:hypothetical protein